MFVNSQNCVFTDSYSFVTNSNVTDIWEVGIRTNRVEHHFLTSFVVFTVNEFLLEIEFCFEFCVVVSGWKLEESEEVGETMDEVFGNSEAELRGGAFNFTVVVRGSIP